MLAGSGRVGRGERPRPQPQVQASRLLMLHAVPEHPALSDLASDIRDAAAGQIPTIRHDTTVPGPRVASWPGPAAATRPHGHGAGTRPLAPDRRVIRGSTRALTAGRFAQLGRLRDVLGEAALNQSCRTFGLTYWSARP